MSGTGEALRDRHCRFSTAWPFNFDLHSRMIVVRFAQRIDLRPIVDVRQEDPHLACVAGITFFRRGLLPHFISEPADTGPSPADSAADRVGSKKAICARHDA